MAWGGKDDIDSLIAKKNYAKAIEVIRAQLKVNSRDQRLRMKLADLLVLVGKGKDAVGILLPLADEYASDGFVAQAISVLKKIQKIDPGRRDVDAKLAAVIEAKQRQAAVSAPTPTPSAHGMELGMEEIGFEIGMPISVAAGNERSAAPVPAPRPEPAPPPPAPAPRPAAPVVQAPPPAAPPRPAPVAPPAPAVAPRPAPTAPAPAPVTPRVAPSAPVVAAPRPAPPPPAPPRPAPVAAAAPPPVAPVVDQDLFAGGDDDSDFFIEPEPESELLLEIEPEAPDPMSDNLFAEELLSVIDEAFANLPLGDDGPSFAPAEETSGGRGGGNQIVVSPLFKDLSVDELVAVIQGLNLLTFEKNKIILRQGDPGNSLYMLSSGNVRAYVKNAQGKQVMVAELTEGAFFGEGSILTGKPRTATIVAADHCELLELDRPTLDGITRKHPHVMDVMKQFARERVNAGR